MRNEGNHLPNDACTLKKKDRLHPDQVINGKRTRPGVEQGTTMGEGGKMAKESHRNASIAASSARMK